MRKQQINPEEYKTRRDWVGKAIHWELCKKFDYTKKWYMNNPTPVLENNTIWDFDIKTDHLIPARQPDLIIFNKKKKKRISMIVDFTLPADHRAKLKESEKKDK